VSRMDGRAMKLILEIDAETLGCASIALDFLVSEDKTREKDEFLKAKNWFDRIYQDMWSLERCGVKEIKF